MSRSRGLPSPTTATRLSQVLDTLTDPGTPGTSDTSVTSGSSGSRDDRDTSGAAGSSVTSVTQGSSDTRKPATRDHVKLRSDLAAEMRDAVWFLSEHGRPRVQLGELLDEAVEAWLAEAKKTYNDGQDLPHRGRLR
jgi:hypothetical protein